MICPLCDDAYTDVAVHLCVDCRSVSRHTHTNGGLYASTGRPVVRVYCPCGQYLFFYEDNMPNGEPPPRPDLKWHYGVGKSVELHLLRYLVASLE